MRRIIGLTFFTLEGVGGDDMVRVFSEVSEGEVLEDVLIQLFPCSANRLKENFAVPPS